MKLKRFDKIMFSFYYNNHLNYPYIINYYIHDATMFMDFIIVKYETSVVELSISNVYTEYTFNVHVYRSIEYTLQFSSESVFLHHCITRFDDLHVHLLLLIN